MYRRLQHKNYRVQDMDRLVVLGVSLELLRRDGYLVLVRRNMRRTIVRSSSLLVLFVTWGMPWKVGGTPQITN